MPYSIARTMSASVINARRRHLLFLAVLWIGLQFAPLALLAATQVDPATAFPPPLSSYADSHLTSVWEVLRSRATVQPFNLIATALFLGAVLHTFFSHKFRHMAHVLEDRHKQKLRAAGLRDTAPNGRPSVSASSRVFHFLGEVEAVFGIWVIPLAILMTLKLGQATTVNYLNRHVNYGEAIFVVVIMAIASTRPVLRLAEQGLRRVAGLGGGGPVAWWFSILTIGPLLGSLITEPAAMTISASLLARQFYEFKPRPILAYATIGLLFVNVSVGGTFTHFAAPPVLMVAGPWNWDTVFMFTHFGWKAALGIVLSNALYYLALRKHFAAMQTTGNAGAKPEAEDPVPKWVTIGHLLFMGFAVANAHNVALVIGGFLLFIAFSEVTQDHQTDLQLRSPMLVGLFLAGLVIHGGLQAWWIAPVLGSLSEVPLMLGATVLTAFNDNAAITYLTTLVPNLSEAAKYAAVAGAVTGGGLTVIANAPNPAGQSILSRYFPDGVSPLGLFAGAFAPTVIVGLCYMLLR